MKKYTIQDIIQIINEKRRKIVMEEGKFPNTMELSKSLLIFIKMQFLITINVPIENIKTMYGMNIIINDYLKTPEEIKIYYKQVVNMNGGVNNLIPMSERSKEEARELGRKGGINSGKVRKEKATFKKMLEGILDEKSSNGKTFRENIALGQIKSASEGKAENFKLILQVLGELQEDVVKETPSVEIKVIDNSNLEKILYEERDI